MIILPSKLHLYSGGPTSSTLVQHCTNVIRMFCVYCVATRDSECLLFSCRHELIIQVYPPRVQFACPVLYKVNTVQYGVSLRGTVSLSFYNASSGGCIHGVLLRRGTERWSYCNGKYFFLQIFIRNLVIRNFNLFLNISRYI